MSGLLHRTRHVLGAGLHTLRYADFGSNLASVQDGVDVGTFERVARTYASDPRWQTVLRERPRFTRETLDMDALAALPDGKQFVAGSVGLPIPGVEICVQNEQGNQLPAGDLGEVCFRGPSIMRGYWKNPEATRQAIVAPASPTQAPRVRV